MNLFARAVKFIGVAQDDDSAPRGDNKRIFPKLSGGDRWIWGQQIRSVTGCAEGRELQLRSRRQGEAAVDGA
jgi:hypothetical protein